MAPALQLFAVIALATSSFAAPASSNVLAKRSFAIPVAGRGKLDPIRENLRAHRKYGREIVALGSETKQAAADSPSKSLPAPSPFVTSTSTNRGADMSTASSPTSAPTGTGSGGSNYSNSSTSGSPSATQGAEDGEVTAKPEQNEMEYLSSVTVGGQKLNLNFDTGSADLWVFSSKQSQNQTVGHGVFDPQKSAKWQPLPDATWQIHYGDDSNARGTVGYDTVDVGGTTVKKQCVEIATYVSDEFVNDTNSDGLLGLAFSSLSTVEPQPQKTFFENVMKQLTEPVFTADLEEIGGAGTYEFGIIDRSKFRGEIHYTPIDNSEGWWQFDTPKFTVGGQERACRNCVPAIADTGTSLIYLDADVVAEYYSKVQGAQLSGDGLYVYPCSAKATLPDLGIGIGDSYVATLRGADIHYAQDPFLGCVGGVQAVGPGEPQIIGDVFLKQFFAVFDGGKLRFGVAEKDRGSAST